MNTQKFNVWENAKLLFSTMVSKNKNKNNNFIVPNRNTKFRASKTNKKYNCAYNMTF